MGITIIMNRSIHIEFARRAITCKRSKATRQHQPPQHTSLYRLATHYRCLNAQRHAHHYNLPRSRTLANASQHTHQHGHSPGASNIRSTPYLHVLFQEPAHNPTYTCRGTQQHQPRTRRHHRCDFLCSLTLPRHSRTVRAD